MKKILLPLGLAALTLLAACSSELDEVQNLPAQSQTAATETPDKEIFPTDDGSKRLSYDPAEALCELMQDFDPQKALSLGETDVTDAEFAEIKDFVDKNLAADTQYKTYRNIFEWIRKNVDYAWENPAWLRAYDVFINKRCVCQGYANLLKTMCITQGIPAIGVNGWLGTIGAHAWNYVYADGKWYVSDPTNGPDYAMLDLQAYKSQFIAERADLNLFEDEQFGYGFLEGHLNVNEIKATAGSQVVVPFSVGGHRITMFCPVVKTDAPVTQVYLGKNVETFSEDVTRLSSSLPELAEIYIDSESERLEAYGGAVYRDGNESPYYIPNAVHRIELKPMKTVGKNTLYMLPQVEEVVVAEGTENIESYAFELCPNLKVVYVPKSVTSIAENAIYDCHPDAQFATITTGITEVRR